MTMKKIEIGKILKAQGIKGEFKVEPLTNNINRFYDLKIIYVNNQEFHIKTVRIDNGYVFLTVNELIDRTAFEKANLVNKYIEIERDDKVLKEGEYYIVDIINSSVSTDGEYLGKLVEILQNSKVDVYVIKLKNNKTVMFPALKKVLKKIDIDKKEIELDKSIFEEIACYED